MGFDTGGGRSYVSSFARRTFLVSMGRVLQRERLLRLPAKAAARWAEKESGFRFDAVSRLGELGYFQVDPQSLDELGVPLREARSLIATPYGSARLSALHADALLRRAAPLSDVLDVRVFIAKLEHSLPILARAVREQGRVGSVAECAARVTTAASRGKFRLAAKDWTASYAKFLASAYYVATGDPHGYAVRDTPPVMLPARRCKRRP